MSATTRVADLVAGARSVQRVVREREVTYLAAALSYYMLVSLVPLLVLAVVATRTLNRGFLEEQLTALTSTYLLPAGQEVVLDALANEAGTNSVTVISIALSVWGALKLFRGLDRSFTRIYGSEPSSMLDQLRDGVVTLVGIGAAILAAGALTAVIGFLDPPFARYYGPVLLVVTLALAFLPVFYLLPDVAITVRQAVPGAVFAAVGWTGLSIAFGYYTILVGASVTGALGGLLLLVTWFYLAGLLLLVGAVLNALLVEDRSDRNGQHPPGQQFTAPDMSDDPDADTDGGRRDRDGDDEPRAAADISQLEDAVEELRADLDAFEADVHERTVEKPRVEAELKRYVRSRMRRGHARGWGPYLVLLYGTVMTLGAFYFLDGAYAIAAMLVLFLSTLGLYTLFVLVGVGLNLLSVPGRAADAVRDRRSSE